MYLSVLTSANNRKEQVLNQWGKINKYNFLLSKWKCIKFSFTVSGFGLDFAGLWTRKEERLLESARLHRQKNIHRKPSRKNIAIGGALFTQVLQLKSYHYNDMYLQYQQVRTATWSITGRGMEIAFIWRKGWGNWRWPFLRWGRGMVSGPCLGVDSLQNGRVNSRVGHIHRFVHVAPQNILMVNPVKVCYCTFSFEGP